MQKSNKTKRKSKSLGLPPGSVVFTGKRRMEEVQIQHLSFDKDELKSSLLAASEFSFVQEKDHLIDWYDIRGMHDTELIESIGKAYRIHPLALESIPDIHQRPKFDEYERGILISCKALKFDVDTRKLETEHVALYFRHGLVFTFQETKSDLFLHLRQRITAAKGRVRQRGADYLAYALLDVLVDHYFITLEGVESCIEDLEERLLDDHTSIHKTEIHHLKRELLSMRKSVSPLREAVSRFSKSDNPLIQESTELYIRDLHDHTIQILDMVESFRDTLNGLQDLFLSEVSLKMNQVMQVLTLTATIFIPLTFLAGIYGMNFEYIPELKWEYGYFYFWGLMIIIGGGLWWFFKKKKWI